MGFGGSTISTSYYVLTINAEVDVFKIVPYKQIFFFTRPWDIMEPAGTGPTIPDDETDSSSSLGDEGSGSSDGIEIDDSTDGEDDGEDYYGRLLRLDQSDSSYSSYDDGSYSSYDASWDLGSGDLGSLGSESAADEAQGFHMFIGAAYDIEVGKVFVSYCEGAYTGGVANIWSIGSTYWTGTPAPFATPSTLMTGDCWMDPELVIELNDLLPPSMQRMLGEVEIFEVKLF